MPIGWKAMYALSSDDCTNSRPLAVSFAPNLVEKPWESSTAWRRRGLHRLRSAEDLLRRVAAEIDSTAKVGEFISLMFQSPVMRNTSRQLSAAAAASLASSRIAAVGTSKLCMLPTRKRSPLEETKLITSTRPGQMTCTSGGRGASERATHIATPPASRDVPSEKTKWCDCILRWRKNSASSAAPCTSCTHTMSARDKSRSSSFQRKVWSRGSGVSNALAFHVVKVTADHVCARKVLPVGGSGRSVGGAGGASAAGVWRRCGEAWPFPREWLGLGGRRCRRRDCRQWDRALGETVPPLGAHRRGGAQGRGALASGGRRVVRRKPRRRWARRRDALPSTLAALVVCGGDADCVSRGEGGVVHAEASQGGLLP